MRDACVRRGFDPHAGYVSRGARSKIGSRSGETRAKRERGESGQNESGLLLQFDLGDFEGAVPLLQEELAGTAELLGKGHGQTRDSAEGLVELLKQMGRDSDAAELAAIYDVYDV